MIFKSRRKLLKQFDKLNDAEKRIAYSKPSEQSGREFNRAELNRGEQQSKEADFVDAGFEQPREKELLPTTEVSDDGTRNNSSGKNSTRIGRIRKRFRRR